MPRFAAFRSATLERGVGLPPASLELIPGVPGVAGFARPM